MMFYCDNLITKNAEKNMQKTSKKIQAMAMLTVIIGMAAGCSINRQQSEPKKENTLIKIGIVTDLTGPAAYWGESTRIGAEIAKKELAQDGMDIRIIFEDYQLDAAKALSAAQKLVNIDDVGALYAEFNPAAISIGSFMHDKNKLFMYGAAVASPLSGNERAYKTYLDYQAGCHEIAQKFKEEGKSRMGMLKLNLEAGELCLTGVKEVFGADTLVEAYNLGDADVKSQVLKLKNKNAEAIINVGFEGDSLNALKAIRELGMKTPFGTVDDTITENVRQEYENELKGAWTFGFADTDPVFSAKIKMETDKTLATEYGAALAYTHIKQIALAISKCHNDAACIGAELDSMKPDAAIGFERFAERIAELKMMIRQY